MDLRPPLRCDEGERLAIIEIQVFRMNRGKSISPERTSTKSDQRNFAFLGFSEVSSVFSPKNGYLAYKKIAIWQRRLVHTQPYTAS